MTFKLGPNQEKWLAALESGEYRQCDEQLCKVDPEGLEQSFCCLGVASKVLRLGCPAIHKSLHLNDCYKELGLHTSVGDFYNDNDETLTLKVGGGYATELTEANDNGATFAEIAAFIRANPEVVFKEPK